MLHAHEIQLCRRAGMREESIEWALGAPAAIVLVTARWPGYQATCPLLPWPEESEGARLAEMLGLGLDTYLAAFERRTVAPWMPWADDPMPADIAAVIADAGRRPIVAVGAEAAHALCGARSLPRFIWGEVQTPTSTASLAWIPSVHELEHAELEAYEHLELGERAGELRARSKATILGAFKRALPVVQWPSPAASAS